MVNINILTILETILGSGKKQGNDEYSFQCPICHHYKKKLQINLTSGKYQCWICGSTHGTKGKSLYSLFKKINASSEQIQELKQILNDKSIHFKEQNVEKTSLFLPKEYVSLWNTTSSIDQKHALLYLKNRGLTRDDILKYSIGYCESGKYRKRIILPSYDKKGILNYFIARSYNDSMKYKNPPFSKNIIFNELFINFNYDIVLCEGIFDAMKIKRNVIPLLGKTIPEKLYQKIIENRPSKIIIYLDIDATINAIKMADELLKHQLNVYLVEPLKNKDAGDLSYNENWFLINKAKKVSESSIFEMNIKENL